MSKSNRYSPGIRQRTVRMVFNQEAEYSSQWAALVAIVPNIGCTQETPRSWVRQTERDTGRQEGAKV